MQYTGSESLQATTKHHQTKYTFWSVLSQQEQWRGPASNYRHNLCTLTTPDNSVWSTMCKNPVVAASMYIYTITPGGS